MLNSNSFQCSKKAVHRLHSVALSCESKRIVKDTYVWFIVLYLWQLNHLNRHPRAATKLQTTYIYLWPLEHTQRNELHTLYISIAIRMYPQALEQASMCGLQSAHISHVSEFYFSETDTELPLTDICPEERQINIS